ncbi:hypothetical protein C2S52_017875 [Perilla frutescens var. hirtella]|nr:hypothetical protein C2S52_017875 [Perilla frutescens var. hirtella]
MNVDLARLVQEQDEPVVYVTEKSIQQTPIHGGPHNFSSEDVASDVEAPNVEFPPLGHWSIHVAHIDDALTVVQDDPSQTDIDAIAVGKIFLEKKDLVIAVGKWHMQRQVEYSVSRSSKIRLTVICKQNEICLFKLVASSKGGLWMVTKLEDNYTCRLDLTHNAPQKLSSRVIADLFRKRILDEGSILKPRAMIAEILREYGIEVEYSIALRARNLAIEMVYGSHDQSFVVLPAYLEMLKRSNPDTIYDLETDGDDHFMYTFIALGVCRAAFSVCMRPVITIDDIHLKGKTKGPIENDAAWTWFMERFKRAFGDRDDLVIVSDQHVSIKNAVKAVYPTMVHGLCYYHIAKNLIRAVQKNNKSFLVNLHMRTCECGEFQLDQIHCSHAAAAIRSAGHDIYDYVDLYFKQVTLCLAYHDLVCSVPSQDEWTVSSSFKVCLPKSVPQAGCPKKGRYRSAGEGSSTKSRRQQVCSRYGGTGHNKKKCTTPQQIEHKEWGTPGEGQRRPKRCSICRQPGNNKDMCPNRVQPLI